MSEQIIQAQIDAINRKLDLILEEVYAQRESRQSMQDLADDVSIIGKDIFKHTVIELDKAGVELDTEALAGIGLKLVRNIDNINEFLEMLESINDFMKDVGPIIHQVGLDTIHKLHELEQKGYIDFFRELSKSLDNIVTHFSAEDVKALSENIVFILETVKNITQPDMLKAVNNALAIYKNLDMENVEEYGIFRAMMEFRKPEMKKGIGFMITFLKKMSELPPQGSQQSAVTNDQ
jgi:uncharacterized protein YjgD (DUF1641 family)